MTLKTSYPEHWNLRKARDFYFETSGIGREYDVRWVKLKTPFFPIYFPNTRGRIRAARLHDLHHIATGYETHWAGEGEIGAWELASGCANYYWAWYLNFSAFYIGLYIAPIRTYRAFLRGRRSSNLYHLETGFSETLLDETVGSLQKRLHCQRVDSMNEHPTLKDSYLFAGWVISAFLFFSVLPLTGLYLLLR